MKHKIKFEWQNCLFLFRSDSKMTKPIRCENNKCHHYPNGQCIGGTAFYIKLKWFCSPHCGNEYWGLKYGDRYYWPTYDTDDDEEAERAEREERESESDS